MRDRMNRVSSAEVSYTAYPPAKPWKVKNEWVLLKLEEPSRWDHPKLPNYRILSCASGLSHKALDTYFAARFNWYSLQYMIHTLVNRLGVNKCSSDDVFLLNNSLLFPDW